MIQDPSAIGLAEWSELSTLLRLLWLFWVLVAGSAGSLLLAHGAIPSLQATRHLPFPQIARLRPLFYGSAGLFLAAAGIVLALMVIRADVIATIYERWWY